MTSPFSEDAVRAQKIEACARAAHEANRAYCVALGDLSQLPWEHAKTWQRESAINGVEGVLAGNGPRESHESWLAEKARTGWKYGPEKDESKKEHPCFVEYDALPEAQKRKDAIFVNVVRTMAVALGLKEDPNAALDRMAAVVARSLTPDQAASLMSFLTPEQREHISRAFAELTS